MPPGSGSVEAAELVEVELARLRALVVGDVVAADDIHATDFQLITPGGGSYSKDGYLAAIASGEVKYVQWEPDEIEARVHQDAGCLRYRSTITIIVGGEESGPERFWHTDFYERQSGRWRIVWSQATRTRS